MSALIHGSIRLPPHDVWSSPMGTSWWARTSRAKKVPTAENPPMVSGEATAHDPPANSSCGVLANDLGTRKWRRPGSSAVAITASASSASASVHSMLD